MPLWERILEMVPALVSSTISPLIISKVGDAFFAPRLEPGAVCLELDAMVDDARSLALCQTTTRTWEHESSVVEMSAAPSQAYMFGISTVSRE